MQFPTSASPLKRPSGRLFVLWLILSFLGICPGIDELLARRATVLLLPPAAGQTTVQETRPSPFVGETVEVGKTGKAGSKDALSPGQRTHLAPIEQSASAAATITKAEMSKLEKLAWTVAKALAPTIAVMAFAGLAALPVVGVVIGAVVIGAAVSGLVNYAFERRRNMFLAEGDKKSHDKILRDVTVAAAVDGVMAPFTMLTAGLASSIGPATIKTVLTTAAKVGATQLAGQTLSNVARAGATNAWYHAYFNRSNREQELQTKISALEKKENRTHAEEEEMVALMKELESLRSQRYTMKDFRQDQRKAVLNAAVSGVLGGAAGQVAGMSNWSKIASTKIFGDPGKSGMIANAVVSNPFAFISGAQNAMLQKQEITEEIEAARKELDKHPADSPLADFYREKIANLERSRAALDPIEAGTTAMVGNLAVQSAIMTTSVAKTRLYDLPQARKSAIQDQYRQQDSSWQKADAAKAELEQTLANPPRMSQYADGAALKQAQREHNLQVERLRSEYERARLQAVANESFPQNKERLEKIAAEYDRTTDLARKADLAKSMGTDAYTKVKMEEIANRPGAPTDPEKIRQLAVDEIRQEHLGDAVKKAESLVEMERRLSIKSDAKSLSQSHEVDSQGRHVFVLKNAAGEELFRREVKTPTGLTAKLFDLDPNHPTWNEMQKAARIAANSGASVKPSTYRATYIDMKISELRGQGLSRAEISKRMPEITADANSRMLDTFGGSWTTIVKSEFLAAGLERAKYQDGNPPDIKALVKTINSTVQTATVSEFQSQLQSDAAKLADHLAEADRPRHRR